MSFAQPNPLPRVKGVKLIIGMVSQGDLQEVVIPICTDDASIDFDNLCERAVLDFIANAPITNWQGCFGSGAFVRFIAAEPMEIGGIPFRQDYGSTTYPGTLGTTSMPSNVTGLMTFYAEPGDLTATQRMRVGKTFMPAPPMAHITGDFIDSALRTAYETMAGIFLTGWGTTFGGNNWYRVISDQGQFFTPANCIRSHSTQVRRYVATQRRRMTPH